MSSVRAVEFFSGIGGLHLAFTRSNVKGSVICAYDFDKTACEVYSLNYPDVVKKTDISTLATSSVACLQADLWLMSPPCQPFTVLSPRAGDTLDMRAKPFIHLIENILPDLVSRDAHPRYLLIENVAGFETSNTRQLLLSTLNTLRYQTFECLLTPLQFGIPNSRLRYYMLAKREPQGFRYIQSSGAGKLWRHIPGDAPAGDWVDARDSGDLDTAVGEIREYLDERQDTSPYLVSDHILKKWGRLFDIVLPSSRRTCCFTRGYTKLVERSGSILQTNESLDAKDLFDQFDQAERDGNEVAVDILRPLRLRYFTPEELLRIFCFQPPTHCRRSDQGFCWPSTISTKTKYRLIGNSVNVKVVTELINYLFL